MAKISVVVPLYNKAPYVSRALKSVFSQTEQDFEIIVVDDGSTDSGLAVVKGFKDSRIKIISQSNSGVSVARNRGVFSATADIVSFLDADDEYLPKFLETIFSLRRRFPSAGVFSTSYRVVASSGQSYVPRFSVLPKPPWEGIIPSYFKCSLQGAPVWTSATAVRVSLFHDSGGFPIGESLGEDLDLWFRMAIRSKIAYSTFEGALYHSSDTNSLYHTQTAVSGFRLIETAKEALRNNQVDESEIKYVVGMINLRLLISITHSLAAGNRRQAISHFIRVRPGPFFFAVCLRILMLFIPTSMFNSLRVLKGHLRNISR